jgi:hypothetical protein
VSADVDGGHPRRDMRRHYAALSNSNQFIISSLCLPNATPAFAITIGSAKVVGDGSARAPADNPRSPGATGCRRARYRRTQQSPTFRSNVGLRENTPGSDLLSHTPADAVPSAVAGLTSVFGMGTGVTLPL